VVEDLSAMFSKNRHYQIVVEGELNGSWSDWLGDVSLELEDDLVDKSQTRISGSLPDQAALRGLLTKIWDLNLTIISINIDEDDSTGGEHER
jgi:hypothetical protein